MTIVLVTGAAAASVFGSSSSLRKGEKRWNYLSRATIRNYIYESKRMKTHESIKSKSSPPSSGTEDSPAAVLEAKAVEEANTLAHFLFLSTTRSSDSAGGGDVVELVLSSESSPSSSSWLSSVSGASEAAEIGTCGMAPPFGRGGREMRSR
jgi:hypothetical protein